MYKVTNHFIPKLISDAPIQNPELQNQSDQKNQAQLSMTDVLMVFFSNKKKCVEMIIWKVFFKKRRMIQIYISNLFLTPFSAYIDFLVVVQV